MKEKVYKTTLGNIHYWTNVINQEATTLVFLPGLTADHRLFEKQIAYFENKVNVFVWDAPGHAEILILFIYSLLENLLVIIMPYCYQLAIVGSVVRNGK